MDYSIAVGEKVVRYDGTEGVITGIDRFGYVQIKYNGSHFQGSYMYDPFINGDVKFINATLQAEVDSILSKIEADNRTLVEQTLATSENCEKYFITKDNEDGTSEVVYRLDCSAEDAHRVFYIVVYDQQKEYRRLHNKWRKVKLFDSLTKEQLAQES